MEVKCPVCKKLSKWEDTEWRPFCSERCKMIDLGEWASEGYRIEDNNDEDIDSNKEQRKEDMP